MKKDISQAEETKEATEKEQAYIILMLNTVKSLIEERNVTQISATQKQIKITTKETRGKTINPQVFMKEDIIRVYYMHS